MLSASLVRVFLLSLVYALLYLPQKCEAVTFVSQFRDILYYTVQLAVHIQLFANIFCFNLYYQSFCLFFHFLIMIMNMHLVKGK